MNAYIGLDNRAPVRCYSLHIFIVFQTIQGPRFLRIRNKFPIIFLLLWLMVCQNNFYLLEHCPGICPIKRNFF